MSKTRPEQGTRWARPTGGRALVAFAAIACHATNARAEAPTLMVSSDGPSDADERSEDPSFGDSGHALPAILDVGVANRRRSGSFGMSGFTGYGFTEAQSVETAGHHRLGGSLAAAYSPLHGVDLVLRLDGRRDSHPDDVRGSDSGWSGEPRLLARYSAAMDHAWRVGGEMGVWIPGRDAPSLEWKATTVDTRGLLAFLPSSRVALAGMLGFRFDQSGKAKPDLARTRSGDRMALGLSDFHAALFGLGAAVRQGQIEWLGEFSADILLGGAAPALTRSPLRLAAGVRYHASRSMQVLLRVQSSLSERPGFSAMDPLIPIDPRFAASLGMVYRFGADDVVRPEVLAKAEVAVVAAAPGKAAPVAATPAPEEPAPGPVAEPVPPAPEVPPAAETAEKPKPSKPIGQLRGLVRSFKGTGLRASIEVEPLALEFQTAPDGTFEVDVPPGRYKVKVKAGGYASQYSTVRVELNGVTILNADLSRRGR